MQPVQTATPSMSGDNLAKEELPRSGPVQRGGLTVGFAAGSVDLLSEREILDRLVGEENGGRLAALVNDINRRTVTIEALLKALCDWTDQDIAGIRPARSQSAADFLEIAGLMAADARAGGSNFLNRGIGLGALQLSDQARNRRESSGLELSDLGYGRKSSGDFLSGAQREAIENLIKAQALPCESRIEIRLEKGEAKEELFSTVIYRSAQEAQAARSSYCGFRFLETALGLGQSLSPNHQEWVFAAFRDSLIEALRKLDPDHPM